MKSFFIAVLSMGIFGHAFAQKLPGVSASMLEKHVKYTIELEKGNKLLIYVSKVHDLEKYQNLDSILTFFIKDYKAIKSSLSETTNGRTVIYRALNKDQFQLDLVEHEVKKQRFNFDVNRAEPLSIKTVQDTLLVIQNQLSSVISTENERVYFCLILNNLDDVEELLKNSTANAHIRKAVEDTKKYSRRNLQSDKYQFNYQQSETESMPFRNVKSKQGSVLALNVTFGVGVFRNQLVPNSQIELSIVPTKYHNMGYTLGWRAMSWANKDALTGRWTPHRNSVLQAGVTFYGFKEGTTGIVDTDRVLFGVYLGRVMSRSGDVFEPDTWNFSITIVERGIVKIQPEVYFNGFFSRNLTRGLRVQIGF